MNEGIFGFPGNVLFAPLAGKQANLLAREEATASESLPEQVRVLSLLPDNPEARLLLAPGGIGGLRFGSPEVPSGGVVLSGLFSTDLQRSREFAHQAASGNHSTIIGGSNNTASGESSTVLGGEGNLASGLYAAVSGALNTASGESSTVLGGQGSVASGIESTVVGGDSCTASGEASLACGGLSNLASGDYAVVAGGEGGTASGEYSVALGGEGNSATAIYATVVGGEDGTASGEYSTVWSGLNNTASADYSCVIGGEGNTASAIYAGVLGGSGNTASGDYARAVGGENNIVSGDYSVVTGGSGNTASGNYATVAGGSGNTASGDYSVVTGGSGNTASGNYATVAGGENNTASADYSAILGGSGAVADLYGMFALASGSISQPGDAQHVRLILFRTTADATPTELTADGAAGTPTTRLTLSDNTLYSVSVGVVGRDTVTGDVAWFDLAVGVKRGTGAGSTALVGSVVRSPGSDAGAAAFDADLVADTVNGALIVVVTGSVTNQVNWSAVLKATKVM